MRCLGKGQTGRLPPTEPLEGGAPRPRVRGTTPPHKKNGPAEADPSVCSLLIQEAISGVRGNHRRRHRDADRPNDHRRRRHPDVPDGGWLR